MVFLSSQYPSTEPVIPDAAQITRELAYYAGIYIKEKPDSELTLEYNNTERTFAETLITTVWHFT